MATTLNVSQRVKDARCDADLTQTELGRKIGKSKQWVSELERQKRPTICFVRHDTRRQSSMNG